MADGREDCGTDRLVTGTRVVGAARALGGRNTWQAGFGRAGVVSDDGVQRRLGQYLNARVTVQYGGQALGFSDTGILTFMDPVWVEVTKDKGERLLIPVASIRHIKLLDMPKPTGDAGTLLRGSARKAHDALE